LGQGTFRGRPEVAGKLAGSSAQSSLKAVCFGVALLSTRKSITSVKAKPARRGGGVALKEREEPPAEAATATKSKAAQKARPDGKVNIKELATATKAKPAQQEAIGTKSESLFAGGLTGGQSAFSSYDYNFDPLGLSEKFPGMCPWFRESELKHGRIAMLAFAGLVAPPVIGALPGLPAKCAASGTGGELMVVEAHNACIEAQMPIIGLSPMLIMLLTAGTIEIVTTVLKIQLGWGLTVDNAGDYPGRKELGAYLKQTPKDDYAMEVLKLQEIKHARLAMIGFAGGITQGALTANGFPWWW